jgi:hypothetical protein
LDACETVTSDQLDALVGPDPRFPFVADKGLVAALPLSLSAGPKRKSDRRRYEASTRLVIRETGSTAIGPVSRESKVVSWRVTFSVRPAASPEHGGLAPTALGIRVAVPRPGARNGDQFRRGLQSEYSTIGASSSCHPSREESSAWPHWS